MNFAQLHPNTGNHAIENVVLVVEWQGRLTVPQLEQLRSVARPSEADFPREDPQQTVSMNFNPLQGVVPAPVTELDGYVYTLYSDKGLIKQQIQVLRNACVFMTTDYERWSNLVTDVRRHLGPIVEHLPDTISITDLSLQYADKFRWVGDLSELSLTAVFCEGSPYIPPYLRECTDQCHSHHGYFYHTPNPYPHRRLDNINININDEPTGARAIQIQCSHKATLRDHMKSNEFARVPEMYDALHSVHEDILGTLLSETVLKMIGFDRSATKAN